jgi:hypothetical protein
LGSETPAIYFDEDDNNNETVDERRYFYGLLQAAGMISDQKDTLKRSARQAMNLVKWLMVDWQEVSSSSSSNVNQNSTTEAINMFGKAFVSLPVVHYKHMNLHLHVTGNENDHRGGAKEDACCMISFILCHHRTETYERMAPVLLEEVVPSPVAQQAYDLWSARPGSHLTTVQQELIKKNTLQRQAEIAIQQRQEAVLLKQQKQLGMDHFQPRAIHHTSSGPVDADLDDDLYHDDGDGNDHPHNADGDHHHAKDGDRGGPFDDDDREDDELDDEEDDDIDELDVMAAIRKRQKTIRKEMMADGGHRGTIHAVRWADSRLAREIAVRERTLHNKNATNTTTTTATTTAAPITNTVRDSTDAILEIQAREDEKAKILGKDPLGIHQSITDIAPNAVIAANVMGNGINNNSEDYFDLRYFEARQAEQIEIALQEIQEDIMRAESMVAQQQSINNSYSPDEMLKKHLLQKASLEQLIESLGGLEMMENAVNVHSMNLTSNKASILPTRPTFNPLLFLTILHRKTAYKELLDSMERLSGRYNLEISLELCSISPYSRCVSINENLHLNT